MARAEWDPLDWQAWISAVLHEHFGAEEYQAVPDRHRGDLGIEGFTRGGVAFQCYAAQGCFNVQDMYEKQRDKISDDIRKFIRNRNALTKLFGTSLKMKRWLLVVPEHDSALLVQHATKKAEEVRSHNLPYVDSGFAIHICTDDAWRAAGTRLRDISTSEIIVDPGDVQPTALTEWSSLHSDEVDNLTRKSEKLTTPNRVPELVQSFLADHVLGQNLLSKLADDYPQLSAFIAQLKTTFERRLAKQCSIQLDKPGPTYQSVRNDFMNEIRSSRPQIGLPTTELLVAEAVADWLLRCPLNFPD